MNETRRGWVLLAACLLAGPGLAGAAWYGGGSYDGYDRSSTRAAIDYPQVNNARGATNVMATSAWLNGMLLYAGSAPASVYVYWGQTDGGTNRAGWTNELAFGTCTEGQMLTTNLTGLAESATYFYRFCATNTAGEEGWADTSASFSTPSAPAVNTGIGAAPVSYANVTLNGNLTAGVTAAVLVYWGTSTNAWSGTNNLGTRSQGAFVTPVTGLSQGTVYFYRCYCSNGYGDGWSAVASFTTATFTAHFYGGAYDGYDSVSMATALPFVARGSTFLMR